MNEMAIIRTALDSQEFKERFRDNLVEEAQQTNTALHYIDEQGRSIEEWPATGERYEVRYDKLSDKTIRIKPLHQPKPALS